MKLKRLLAVLLCCALFACCAPIALAAPDTATVAFWFSNGDELQAVLDLTVSDGTAESYGYTVAQEDHTGKAIETVTAMDVLVAAHKAIYGDAFTAETADDYLVINNSYLGKAFGIETSNLGFTVNDAAPHDDTYVPAYYGYTGYAIDTACVQDGDRICLYTIQDTESWADVLPQFDKTAIDAVTDEAFTVSVDGYNVVFYGFSTQETIDALTKPLEGVTVECTQDFETFTAVGTLDENGEISVTLPDAGTYYLVVRGMFDDEDLGDVPVIASFCTVTVTPAPDTATVAFWLSNGDQLQAVLDLTAADGMAESYGYTVAQEDHTGKAIETVTAMDVLVAAHKAIYGDAFTAETAEDYLALGNYGLTKAFGIETGNLGFTVNDATPHDDTFVESEWGGGYYTGYTIDTARVQDGDRVCLFMYQDTVFYADIVPVLDGTSIDAVTDEAFTFSAGGYSIMYYGFGKQEGIDANTIPLEGATVEYTQDFENFTTVGTLDEDGKISVTFSDAGEYYLVVRGTIYDENLDEDVPVIASFCTVTVTPAPDTATVTFWYSNGDELLTALDLTVSDGTAESYGYTVAGQDHTGKAIETVTAMDVLVAAHKAIYGDAFTAETASDYLVVGSSFITKAFGLETSNLGFTINDATPHDDTYVPAYYGYTGYAIDTARVQDGDRVCLFVYKDAYWSDIQPLFDRTTVEAEAHKTFTVSLNGYIIMYYGCGTQETIDANTKPLEGATVEYTQDFKTFTTVGTVGKDGKASVKLPQVGTYYLVVRGSFNDEDMGSLPVIANICTVEAKEPTLTEPTLTIAGATDKTAYFAGEALDTKGLSLVYTDQYGEAETVTEGFVCAPMTLAEAGTQTVTVTYEGLSATFEVTVEPIVPVSLTVVSAPTNNAYTYKQTPDFSGLVVRVQYNDGSERIEDDLSKMDIRPTSEARVRRGTQTFSVRVDGVSTTIEMQVRLQFWQWLILILLFGWIWY